MKNIFCLSFIAILTAISIIIPSKAQAIDIIAGATTWYAQGEPIYYNKSKNDIVYYPFQSNSAFLCGPAISVKFNEDFNLTFLYLYGKFNYNGKVYFDGTAAAELEINFKSKRNDADLALNYTLNSYFKVFIGVKYLSFDMQQIIFQSSDAVADKYSYRNQGEHKGIGPGLGIGAVFPIIDNLFLLSNLSGFHLLGTSEKIQFVGISPDGMSLISYEFKSSFKEYGFNANLSLAYYIVSASTAINLGGRLQHIRTDYKDDRFPVKIKQTLRGITLSAAYGFSI